RGSLAGGESDERLAELPGWLRHLIIRLADRAVDVSTLLHLAACDPERSSPDPPLRRVNFFASTKKLGEGLRHRIAGYFPVAGVREEAPPEPVSLLPVELFNRICVGFADQRRLGHFHPYRSLIGPEGKGFR